MAAFADGQNPGNDIYERAPAIASVLQHPQVVGALTSLLGPGYHMDCHRHCHLTESGQGPGGYHQDGTFRALKGWSRPWRYWHRPRKVLLAYSPHEVPEECGPTAVAPGSHYFRRAPEGMAALERRFSGGTGTIAIVNFSIWHRAGANVSGRRRIVLKFLFERAAEPRQPTWRATPGYRPDFAALAADCAGEPAGRLLRLPNAWQTMWRWLNGQEAAAAAPVAVGEQLPLLESADEAAAIEAAYRLGGGLDEAAAAVLLQCLRRPEGQREWAALALSAANGAAVPALGAALVDADPWVRATAADIAADLGRASLDLVPQIGRALGDEDPFVRHNAAQALQVWGADAVDAEAGVVQALEDEEPFVRYNAIGALLNMGWSDRRRTAVLEKVAAEDKAQPRWRAADALRQLQSGPMA